MAKGVYKKWLEKDNLILLQGWKRNGLTDEQIAANIGIAPRTLERWKKSYSQIRRVLKSGKEEANFVVENALLKRALEGNTTAQIFYLKNNWSSKYSDNRKSDEEKQLITQQVRKAKAEADIAAAKAKAYQMPEDGKGSLIKLLAAIDHTVEQGDSHDD